MSRRKGADLGLVAYLVGILSGGLMTLIVLELRGFRQQDQLAEFRDVRDFARDVFVREVSDEELLELALDGMLRGLDEYGRYYGPQQSTRMEAQLSGRSTGIGAVFRHVDGERRMLFSYPESAARRAGMQVGDAVVEVGGREVRDVLDSELQRLLSGPLGARIAVTLEDLDGEQTQAVLELTSQLEPTVKQARMVDSARGVGYVSLRSFTRETPAEFDAAVTHLEQRGLRGLILDLRANQGGRLESAVQVAQRFLPEGLIVSTEGRGESTTYEADARSATLAGLPLCILVDGRSASASEVLASALQDHRVAVLCGAPTYGKGVVQTVREFQDYGTRAKVTSAYYYSPSRRNFERSAEPGREYGLLPDVWVQLGEQERRELASALSRLTPPTDQVAAIEAWEARLGRALLPRPPQDRQFAAGLALFRGENPGPSRNGR